MQKLDAQAKTDDVEGMKAIASQLAEDPAGRDAGDPALVQRPVGPGQRRGLDELALLGRGHAQGRCPTMWRNWLELGGVLTLTELQPAGG